MPESERDAAGTRAGAWWIHPFGIAAFPVLFLFAQNLSEQITLDPLWLPLAAVVAGTAAVLLVALLLGRLLDVGAARSALAASLGVGLALTYGHAWNLVGEVVRLHRWLLAAWVVLGLLGLVVILRLGPAAVRRATRALNASVALLVAINVVPIAAFAVRTVTAEAPAQPSAASPGSEPTVGDGRDVWYIVLDRYAGSDALREEFGYDNAPFLDALREAGFVIAEDASANYLKTAMSLAASLNMEELDLAALETEASAPDDWGPIYRRIHEGHALASFLKARGYEYLHVGSRRGPTSTNALADINYVVGVTTEFSAVLADTTILAALQRVGTQPVLAGEHQLLFAQTKFQFETMHRLADDPGPTFVFAHLLVPHPPYVFNEDGSRVSGAQQAARTPTEQYLEQLRYANARVLEHVERLHAGDPESRPIIVIAADEGPFPSRYAADEDGFGWLQATPEELLTKFSILTAVSMPGAGREELEAAGFSDAITPVNLFRVVLDVAFDAGLEPLPDRNWVFVDGRDLYEQVEVTDRVRPLVEPDGP